MMIHNLKPAKGAGESGPFIPGQEIYATDFSQKFRDVIQKLVNLNKEGEEPGLASEENTLNAEETGTGKNPEQNSSAGYQASAIFPDDAGNFYTVIKFIGEDEAATDSSTENEEISEQEQAEAAEETGEFTKKPLTEEEQGELNKVFTADVEQDVTADEEANHNSLLPSSDAPVNEEQPATNENQYNPKEHAGFAQVQKNNSQNNPGFRNSGGTVNPSIVNGNGNAGTSSTHRFSAATPESRQLVQMAPEEQNSGIFQKPDGTRLKAAGNHISTGDLEFQPPKKKPENEEKISLNMLSKSGTEPVEKESSELFRRDSAMQTVSAYANETGAAEEPENPFEFTFPKNSEATEKSDLKEIQQVKDPGTAKAEMPSSTQVSNNKNFVSKVLHAVRENLQSTRQTENGWKPHQFVFDDGSKVQFGVRQMEGVIQLKLGSSNSELNRLIQQHAGEIREHLENEMDVSVDLQFESSESENHFPKEAQGGKSARPGEVTGPEAGKTAEPEPVISRSFGFNNNEWTA